MRRRRLGNALVVVTLLGAFFAAGTGAQAGPISAHTITGASDGHCYGDWFNLPCWEAPLELHAIEGVGGTAIYRPYEETPVPLTLTCMSFSNLGGAALTSLAFHPRAESPAALSGFGLSGHVFRGSGVSQDGQTYYIVVVDTMYSDYNDYYYVSRQRESGPCGTGNYLAETRYGSFQVTHAGNVSPRSQFEYSCEGRTCTFDGKTSLDLDGYVVSYEWSFLEGEELVYLLAKDQGPSATFTYPETYGRPVWARLEVTDDSGDSMSVFRRIYAN